MYSAEVATSLLRREMHDPNLRVMMGPDDRWVVAAKRRQLTQPTMWHGVAYRGVREFWDIFHVIANPDGSFRELDARIIPEVRAKHVEFAPKLGDYVRARYEQQVRQDERSHAEGRDRIQYDVHPRVKKWAQENM